MVKLGDFEKFSDIAPILRGLQSGDSLIIEPHVSKGPEYVFDALDGDWSPSLGSIIIPAGATVLMRGQGQIIKNFNMNPLTFTTIPSIVNQGTVIIEDLRLYGHEIENTPMPMARVFLITHGNGATLILRGNTEIFGLRIGIGAGAYSSTTYIQDNVWIHGIREATALDITGTNQKVYFQGGLIEDVVSGAGAVMIGNNGNNAFYMEGGEIRKCSSAAVQVQTNGLFYMSGGKIWGRDEGVNSNEEGSLLVMPNPVSLVYGPMPQYIPPLVPAPVNMNFDYMTAQYRRTLQALPWGLI